MIDTNQTVSKHSVSLDRLRWGRPALDPSLFNKLLEALIKDDEDPVTVGEKRRAEDSDAHIGPSKRLKLNDVTNGIRAQGGDGGGVGSKLPAFKHTYDCVFTLSPPGAVSGYTSPTVAYRKEVEVLKQTLCLFHQSSATSARGDVVLPATVRRNYSVEYMNMRCTLEVYLPGFNLSLFTIDVDYPLERHGSRSSHQNNPIDAAHLLGPNHGVDFNFTVRLRPTLDPDHSPEHALPLKISIEMEGSLWFPQIARPPKNTRGNNYSDAWNTLIRHIFPPPPADFPNYRGETDITFLYSILEPAPSLPSTLSSAYIQPKALLPSLLPFQQRSVLWMLHREGKTFNKKGQVVSFTPDYLPLFWDAFQVGGQTVYLNRLNETLSLAPPPSDVEHPGGSLNEAPGLGKTVECLALILLNPDIRRNPSVKRWDPNAEVYVREVHVSGYMLHLIPFLLIETHVDNAHHHTCYSGFTMARRI